MTRLALVVLLSELLLALAGAPSGACHHVHRATIDAVATHATSARLPRDGETQVRRAAARDVSCLAPAAAPIVARASSDRASSITAPERIAFTRAYAPRARGPPAAA